MDEKFVRPASILFQGDLAAQETEVVALRRENGKTFDLGNKHFLSRTSLGAVHYKTDPTNTNEAWKEVELTISPQGQMGTATYTFSASRTAVGYSYISNRGGRIDVDLLEIGTLPVDTKRIKLARDGNLWFWNDAADGVDLKAQLRSVKAEIFKQLADADAPRRFLWRIREDVGAECQFVRVTGGKDANNDPLEIQYTVSNEHVVAEVDRTYTEFLYEEVWTGRVSRRISAKTRQRDWFDDPAYPVIIDAATQELTVADADDGYEYAYQATWQNNYGGNVWEFGRFGGNPLNGGTRFQTLGIPQGATINTATITIDVTGRVNVPTCIVYADDVDDAPAWSNNSLPSDITQTAASTAFTPAGTGTYTVGVTGIVQEIINRGGWSSGYDVRFGWIGPGTGAPAYAYVYDYAQGQAGAATLDIDYDMGVRIPRHPAQYNTLAIY